MNPIKFSYTPEDNNLTGFASNVTGATWTISDTTVGDGLAHQVTIRNDSATDHSGKTALLTGTDSDGLTQTETITLPGVSATVTSTKYWATLVTAVPSATIGADTMDIGWNDVAIGPTFPLNWRQQDFQGTLGVNISGTINYTLQYCLDPLYSSGYPSTLTWWNHDTLASLTADAQSNFAFPVTATRVLVNSLTAGATIALHIVQGN